MSTRGLYGFRRYGIDKTTYNHYDSYPENLGLAMLEFCANTSIEEMKHIYDNIILVDQNHIPTDDMIKHCLWLYHINLDVASGRVTDWYCLLHETQGDMNRFKTELKHDKQSYMIDNHEFIKDSISCEYAYIINIDTLKLEFWLGFQKVATEGNRYGTQSDTFGYFPCKMVLEIPLENITNIDKYVSSMRELADRY